MLINILSELKRGPDALMDCGLLYAKIRHLLQEGQSQTLQEAKTVFGLGGRVWVRGGERGTVSIYYTNSNSSFFLQRAVAS